MKKDLTLSVKHHLTSKMEKNLTENLYVQWPWVQQPITTDLEDRQALARTSGVGGMRGPVWHRKINPVSLRRSRIPADSLIPCRPSWEKMDQPWKQSQAWGGKLQPSLKIIFYLSIRVCFLVYFHLCATMLTFKSKPLHKDAQGYFSCQWWRTTWSSSHSPN